MSNIQYKDLLDAGVHFGHLASKWNPKMAPYIFAEKNEIHLIDLNKTIVCLDEATNFIRGIIRSGRKILFVATKKQAKEIVSKEADRLKMPYVTERWLGGMLTNFTTVRKSLKKMSSLDRLIKEDTYNTMVKKERLMVNREREKLQKILGGIADQTRLPAALFIVDIKKEHIAVAEAHRLGIPVIGIVDTNSDPNSVEFPIPGNDDAYKSIAVIVQVIGRAIEEGLEERKMEKEIRADDKEEMSNESGDVLEDTIKNYSPDLVEE
ncbi:MAG: 30S ribosomal protein S2 [Cytophagales bacterium]|nr:30S ribosomal protein S2 [Cytophagales bacterium]